MEPDTEEKNKPLNVFKKNSDGSYTYLGEMTTIPTVTNLEEAKTYMIRDDAADAATYMAKEAFNMASITFRKDALPELNLDDEYLLNTPRCNGNGKSKSTWEEVWDTMTNVKKLSKQLLRMQEYTPKKIIQNGPAFIVIWSDGTKTVLKRKDGDQDDRYAAFGQALMIKIFGNNSRAHAVVDSFYENPFLKYIQDGLREIDTNQEVNDDNS